VHFLPPHKQNKEKKMSTESDLMANMLGHLDKAMAKPPICDNPDCDNGVIHACDTFLNIADEPCPTCQKEADNG